MLYAIAGLDTPDSLAGRVAARSAHLARVSELRNAGRLILAGPHPNLDTREPGDAGYSGSLIIAQFESLADAETWAQADPYVAAGVWASISVKPFVQVMP
ncbi:MAG: YciI family protein [Gammaproteobacteria bacterium]